MSNKIQKNLIKITSDLINFETTKENYSQKMAVIEYVKNIFKGDDVYFKTYSKAGNPSVVITLRKEKNPKIILSGHLDVVPASKAEFTAKIKEGKIYGRGSGDMKAGCAAMIETIKYFSKQKEKPSLGLMLTTDEESGGANGVGYLVEEKNYRPELVIIPDGGLSLKTIVTHQKGVLHLKVKSYGKAAHGSRPFLGENAADKLINVYQKLKKAIPEVKKQKWKNTMNLGKIQGGEATNKVPHYAEMHLDIRYIESKDKEIILKKISETVEDFEIVAEGTPFFQESKHEHINVYRQIIEEEMQEKIAFHKVEGASDARYFSQRGIPAIITKINCGNIHADNEWVEIREMEIFYKGLVKFIKKVSEK